jgi:uncharacterized protein (PEP-CTERM system associated)
MSLEFRVRLGLLVSACAAPLAAAAGDWDIVPRFTLEESYTDNVALSDVDASGDFITKAKPGLSVHGRGARITSDIDYNLEYVKYLDSSDFDGSNHQLQGATGIEVIEDRVFVDTRSTMSQQAIDNRGLIARDTRSVNANRSDVTSYEVSPRALHHFGAWADAEMSYTHATTSFSSGSLGGRGDGTEDGFDLQLRSGRRIARTPLALTVRSSKTEYESGITNEIRSAIADVSYIWSRKFRFKFTGGYDDNDFQSSRGTSGAFWLAGGQWTPSPRTSIGGQWGHRFFGNTYNADISHRHRRLNVSLKYNEEVRTITQAQRELVLIPLEGPDGLPIFDPVDNGLIDIPLDTPSVSEETYLSKDLNIAINYRLQRGTAGITYGQATRTFQLSGQREKMRNLAANWSHSLSRKLTLRFRFAYREAEFGAGTGVGAGAATSAGTDELISLTPALDYKLGPHTTARLSYDYTDNSSSGTGGVVPGLGFPVGRGRSYTENAVIANLVFHL